MARKGKPGSVGTIAPTLGVYIYAGQPANMGPWDFGPMGWPKRKGKKKKVKKELGPQPLETRMGK